MVRGEPAGRPRVLLMLLATLLLATAATVAADPPDDDDPFSAGRPLADALLALRDRGLQIVFTSQTVDPSMRVVSRPEATEPRRMLDELLAPHGLEAREGPRGSVVVVTIGPGVADRELAITGRVLSRDDSRPLSGVVIEVVETGATDTSEADGSFRLDVAGEGPYSVDVRRPGFVIEHLLGVRPRVAHAPRGELEIFLDRAPVTQEQVLVTPSRLSLLREQPARPLALSRDDIFALPHLGDDLFRALDLLPGVAGNDVSAEFNVRGGRADETQLLLDGQELYEAYHLKDFDNALSIVAATALGSVDLSTGGFPVEHGDRMGGVLDMTTRTPAQPRTTQIGISPFTLDVGSSGRFADGRGGWLAQGRRGAIDLLDRLLGPERPQYWDVFARTDFELGAGHSLRLNLLHSDDELEFEETGVDGFKFRETRYQSSYLWLTHRALVGNDLMVESALSRSRVDRDRRGIEIEDDAQFDIDDRRELEVAELRQHGLWIVSPRHSLKWGFELRDFETRYDYAGQYAFDNPLAVIRVTPEASSTLFQGAFDAEHRSVYLADRARLGEFGILELGVRSDRHTLTDESLVSPRLNLALDLGEYTVLRASWGRFTQSQRPYELQVEDGETTFDRVERSRQQVLGVEHLFPSRGPGATTLRIEAYRREIDNPLRRYENLYEPINTFPEVEPDRVLVAPSSSRTEGLELFLRGRGSRLGWWVNYSHSRAEDVIDGTRVRRRFDQPHALNLDLDVTLGARWTLNLAWRYHTGWPTTPLTLEESIVEEPDDEGEIESEVVFLPVLGRPFSDRLPDYHRLDVRASRRWTRGAKRFTLFVDVQNAYDRRNVSGYDFDIDEDEGLVVANQENWAQVLPSIGIRVEF